MINIIQEKFWLNKLLSFVGKSSSKFFCLVCTLILLFNNINAQEKCSIEQVYIHFPFMISSEQEDIGFPMLFGLELGSDLPELEIQLSTETSGLQYFKFIDIKKDDGVGIGPYYIMPITSYQFEFIEPETNCSKSYLVASPYIDSSLKTFGYVESEILPCDQFGDRYIAVDYWGTIDKFEAVLNGVSLGEFQKEYPYIGYIKVGPINDNNEENKLLLISKEESYEDNEITEEINFGNLECGSEPKCNFENIRCDFYSCDLINDSIRNFGIKFHNYNPSESGYTLAINGGPKVEYKYNSVKSNNTIGLGQIEAQDFYFTLTDIENPECSTSYFYEHICEKPFDCNLDLYIQKIKETETSFFVEVEIGPDTRDLFMLDVFVNEEYQHTRHKSQVEVAKSFTLGPFNKEKNKDIQLKFVANRDDECFYEKIIKATDHPDREPEIADKKGSETTAFSLENKSNTSIQQNEQSLNIECNEAIHSVALFDLNGKALQSKKNSSGLSNTEEINLSSNILPGIYILKIQLKNKVTTRKIFIQ